MQSLAPPTNLKSEKTFVVSYDFDAQDFTLILRNGHSFDLGLMHDAQHYFWTIGLEALGEKAMNSAMNFGAAQAIPAEQRAFGLNLTAHDAVDPKKPADEEEVLVI